MTNVLQNPFPPSAELQVHRCRATLRLSAGAIPARMVVAYEPRRSSDELGKVTIGVTSISMEEATRIATEQALPASKLYLALRMDIDSARVETSPTGDLVIEPEAISKINVTFCPRLDAEKSPGIQAKDPLFYSGIFTQIIGRFAPKREAEQVQVE